MIVSINQPAYLPWPGYFHRISVSDVHIVLDHVQFEKNSLTNRNKVRTSQSWTWLTVPLLTSGSFGNLAINAVRIASNQKWAKKHWETLRLNYVKSAYFEAHSSFFEGVFADQWERLDDLLQVTTNYLVQSLGISTPRLYSSNMKATGHKSELILNLCREAGATTYLSGPLGRAYLQMDLFEDAGIQVRFHDYRAPTYRQAFPGFEPFLSVVDLLFNCGPQSFQTLAHEQELMSK